MTVRPATAADAAVIADIHAASWQFHYQDVLSPAYLSDVVPHERQALWKSRFDDPKPSQQVFVAELDGEIVGFACVYARENPQWGAYLDNLHVRPAHQSRGIGQTLMTAVMRWCQAVDPEQGLCLLVNRNNVRAQTFYRRVGARNAEASVWNAPDGSAVPTYWFVWDRLDAPPDGH